MPSAHGVPLGRWYGPAARRRPGAGGLAAADGRLDQLRQPPVREAKLVRVGAGLVGGGQRVPVAAEPIAQHRAGMPNQAQPHALAPDRQAVDGRVDEPGGLIRAPLPAGQRQRAIRRQVVPGRLRDGRGLIDERGGRPELPGVQEYADPLGQGERQQAERAGIAGELEVPGGHLVPALVVPHIMGGMTGHEEPPQLVLKSQPTAAERGDGSSHRRRSGLIPVGDQDGQPVQQQVRRAPRQRCGRRAERGHGHLGQADPASQPPDVHRGGQCIQVSLAGQPQVERLHLASRMKQQSRGISAVARGERHLAVQQADPGAQELIGRPCLSLDEQLQRRVGQACGLSLGGRQSPACRARVRSQRRRTLEERGPAVRPPRACARLAERSSSAARSSSGSTRPGPGARRGGRGRAADR